MYCTKPPSCPLYSSPYARRTARHMHTYTHRPFLQTEAYPSTLKTAIGSLASCRVLHLLTRVLPVLILYLILNPDPSRISFASHERVVLFMLPAHSTIPPIRHHSVEAVLALTLSFILSLTGNQTNPNRNKCLSCCFLRFRPIPPTHRSILSFHFSCSGPSRRGSRAGWCLSWTGIARSIDSKELCWRTSVSPPNCESSTRLRRPRYLCRGGLLTVGLKHA